jgi:hypothetical protein
VCAVDLGDISVRHIQRVGRSDDPAAFVAPDAFDPDTARAAKDVASGRDAVELADKAVGHHAAFLWETGVSSSAVSRSIRAS